MILQFYPLLMHPIEILYRIPTPEKKKSEKSTQIFTAGTIIHNIQKSQKNLNVHHQWNG